MKYFLPLLLLAGCSTTVPVTQTFPNAPPALLAECEDLTHHEQSTKLSKFLETVVTNYGKYRECQIKQNGWIQWYTEQKKIFETIKE